MIKFKKIFFVLIVGVMLLTGCSNNEGKENEGTYNPDETVDISWMVMLHTASAPNEVIKGQIEEYTNSNLTFTWVPDASKDERITTALASGELADIVTLTMMDNSSVRNALKSGMFWEVEDYLKDYPNLAKISQDRIDSAKVDGVLYGIPFEKALARSGLVLRQDWLDNLGLEAPTNLDGLKEVARAFTEDDPDGNGVNDTVAFGDRSDLRYSSFKLISVMNGAPNDWGVDANGEFIPAFDTPEYREAMEYQREMYEKGYIMQDFAVTSKDDQQQQFAQGKTGIYTGMIDIANLRKKSEGLQEGIELVPVNKISKNASTTDVNIWSEGNGVNGILAFPKSYVTSEEQLKRILQFVNDLYDEEVYMLMTMGIEGTHYEMVDGAPVKLDNDLWAAEVQPFSGTRPSEVRINLVDANPEKQLANELIVENDAYAVLNPAKSLESTTYNEKGTELDKIPTDATIQFIMGQITMDEYNSQIQQWYDQGGTKIVEEYEAAYKVANQN